MDLYISQVHFYSTSDQREIFYFHYIYLTGSYNTKHCYTEMKTKQYMKQLASLQQHSELLTQ